MLTQDEINEYFAVADELRVQFDDTYIQHCPDIVKRRNLELCTGCGAPTLFPATLTDAWYVKTVHWYNRFRYTSTRCYASLKCQITSVYTISMNVSPSSCFRRAASGLKTWNKSRVVSGQEVTPKLTRQLCGRYSDL